jgi:hypothetical protein
MTLKQNFIRNAKKSAQLQNFTYRIKIYQHYSFNTHFLLHLETGSTQDNLNFAYPFYLCALYDSKNKEIFPYMELSDCSL